MGDLWESAVAAAGGVLVAWVTGRRAVRWARLRCDQALDAATGLAPPAERNLIVVAGSGHEPDRRAQSTLGGC